VFSLPPSGSSRPGASATTHFMARRLASRWRGTGIAPARLNRSPLGRPDELRTITMQSSAFTRQTQMQQILLVAGAWFPTQRRKARNGPPTQARSAIQFAITPLAMPRLGARACGAASGAPANSMALGAPAGAVAAPTRSYA
jgi:hypothetical protein